MAQARIVRAACAVALLVTMVSTTASTTGAAGRPGDPSADRSRPSEHWTPERRAAAVPRDLVLDHRGLPYISGRGGELTPHGHGVAAERTPLRAVPSGKPSNPGGGGGGAGGSSDSEGPLVSDVDPASGTTIGDSHTFSATVVDPGSGVRSVTFELLAGGQTQSFAASASGSTWTVTLTGFTDGPWQWRVIARDNAKRGGNTTTTDHVGFTVDTGGSGGGGGGTGADVTNARWTAGGPVQTAAGRIFFEMPANKRGNRWNGYVCSGTVATDGTTNRSVILTAAHCVYDDVNKAFARNVLFIPDQDGTSGGATDRDCSNDPLGCWEPSLGVVDDDWTTRTFPDNIPWDYAFYVVADPGHIGAGTGGALDSTAGSLAIDFGTPALAPAVTHALGYSYSDDPNFMYCAEPMATEATYGDWWLPNCGLSGGSSGGPWIQPMSDGSGPVISVNSWGYTNQPGMAGPMLNGTSASCLFQTAKGATIGTPQRGVAPGCAA